MHRTTFLPGSLGLSLLLGFLLGPLARVASAQGHSGPLDRQIPAFGQQARDSGDAKGLPEPYIIVLPRDSTRQIEMSTKELIAEFRSENPRIVRAQALLDNPRAVLITGVAAGSTRIYISDVKKNTESFEVRVPQDEDADREARRRELLDQIRRAVPTASVDVLTSGNNTVLLTGNVPLAESVQVLYELTRGVFGPAVNIVNATRIGGVQQVQLEVTVARVNRSKARQIGFTFLQTGNQHYLASTVAGGGSLTATSTLPSILAPAATLATTPNAVFGIFNDKEGFFGYLNALTTEGLAKLISEPRVMTLSGRPAWIVSGGETPILTTSGTGAPSVSYKMFGTIVSCLPIVLGNGKIHLEVRPEISNLNVAAGISLSSSVGTTTVPGFDLRTAQVTVEMEDGQTLAIGGLIQNSVNGQNTKVPILGDIPVIGFAFSSKTYKAEEEEFIILVTPHLVDPMACCQLPKYLPGRETRSADDFELFLEGILEAPRGQRTLTRPYQAAYLNGASSAVYPCGDASGCGSRQCPKPGAGPCSPFSTAAGCAPSGTSPNGAAPPKAEIRPVANTALESSGPVPTPVLVQEAAPMVPASLPTTLPTLPPMTHPGGAPGETRLPLAVFGPVVLTDQ